MSHQREETGGARGFVGRVFVPLAAALQFLTLFPPLVHRMFTSEEMGWAVGFFPLIGALLGALLAVLDWGLVHILPVEVSTALLLAALVGVTGALHLDGFLDACDGLFGGHTPERRLEIMHDERVGAFGLAGGVLLLLIEFTALTVSANRAGALISALALSRWAMALAIVYAPYARTKGLGRAMKDHAGSKQVALATIITLILAWFAGGWRGLLSMMAAGAVTWLATRYVLKKLPGLTGDIYGAIAELTEASVLLLFAVRATS